MAADVATGDVETFGGETVGLVKTEEGGVQVVYNGQTVNVVTADVEASNGVIHVIDNVIVGAPAPVEEIAPRSAAIDVDLLEEVNEIPEVAKVGDVVDVAVGNGAFTTLVKVVSDLGLVETLKGVEAVTIFAPSDDAFAKLPEGTLESLTPEQAKAIVARHVVAGATVMAADVATGDVETFGGETVGLVKTEEGGVQVVYNGQTVNVVAADVGASNGVIHVIDNVIVGAPEPAPEAPAAEAMPEAPAMEEAPEAPAAEVGDVVDVAVGAGAFTTLVKVVSDLGLVETLKGVEAVTIFAPSDEAFAKLPEGTLESLTPEQAKAIVARHVVAGATVMAADVATGDVGTFGGETVGLVKTEEGGVQVVYNGQTVNVVLADVGASNGVIHVIDNVIVGAPAPEAPAAEAAPETPVPEAAPEAPAAEPVAEVPVEEVGDVVDVAVGAGAFTTLVKVVSDLGLVETLKGVEAVTIFAPSDDAFAKLPEGTLESLTPEQAKAIVARHVVAGATVMAADVATGDVETFGGETVGLVKTEEGGVQVVYNGQTVNVVTPDVAASNGVIHVIDNVIVGAPEPVPEAEPEPEVQEAPVAEVGDVVDVAVGNGAFTTLVKIVSDLGLVETLKGVEAVTIFAPSDDAFAKLPEGTLESLSPEQAKAIVSRHVVAGATVMAADVTTGPVGTFGGENIDLIKTEDGGVQVSYNGNAVNVVAADVKASNGVIHVIDAVIL